MNSNDIAHPRRPCRHVDPEPARCAQRARLCDDGRACRAHRRVANDDSLQVVVLRGAGKHFMAGGDIRTFAEELGRPAADRERTFTRSLILARAIEQLHQMPQPLVAQVQGAVAGFGLSLMNACDLVVAADDAYFRLAYRHLALTPDGGSGRCRVWSARKAMEILPLSERFDAAGSATTRDRQQGRRACGTRSRDQRHRRVARRRATACSAQHQATGSRVARATAVRTSASRGGQLVNVRRPMTLSKASRPSSPNVRRNSGRTERGRTVAMGQSP